LGTILAALNQKGENTMKKILTSFIGVATIASAAFAGTEYTGKEMRQTAVAPEECWYADNEWNVSLWGTYAFTGTESRGIGAPDFFAGGADGDRYLETDHAWGGGGDVKYFWHRYFGFGVEGFGLDAKRTRFDFTGVPTAGGFVFTKDEDRRAIGAVLGTFTIRYPIGCSRFAPYAWAGGGSIFGGGDRDRVVATGNGAFATEHGDGEGKGMGQFGGGMEVRITRHIGWMSDFSWNVVDGPHNNFGMVRSGLTFAF
jgi:hypothetical protein